MAKTLVGALRVTLGLDSAEFASGAARVQNLSAQMAKKLAVIGTAVSVVGAGVATAIRGAINSADDMGELAQKLGVPVEALSALKYAAEKSGVSFEELQGSLLKLSRGMADSPEKFEKLGIAVRDAQGEIRPAVDVLKDIADRFKAMPDGAEKSALAMELFGKSGASMILALNGGGEGLQALLDRARELGLVISQETSEAAGNFNDNLHDLGAIATGLATIIAAKLAPVLEKISAFVLDMAAAFQNLDPATQEFIAWAAALAVILGPVLLAFAALAPLLALLFSPLVWIAAAIGAIVYAFLHWEEIVAKVKAWIADLVENGLNYLANALGYTTEEDIAAFKQGFWDAIERIKQSFRDLAANIGETMETIKNGIVAAWDWIKTSVGGAIDWLGEKWDTFIGKLQSAIQIAKEVGQAIADSMKLPEGFADKKGQGYGGLGGYVPGSGTLDPASYSTGAAMTDGIVTGAVDQMNIRSPELAAAMTVGLQAMKDAAQIASPSKVTEGYGRNLAEGLAQGITQGKDIVGQAAKGLTDTAAGAMKGIGDLGSRIGDMFATAATNVLTGVESLRDAVGKLIQQLAQLFINSAMKSLFGDLFDGLNLGGLNGYATGTLNAAAGWAMVGEEGPELVRMRGGERVFDARQTDRMTAAGAGGAGAPQQMVTQVYLDGELILNQIDTPQGEAVIARVNRRLGR